MAKPRRNTNYEKSYFRTDKFISVVSIKQWDMREYKCYITAKKKNV
jgi:hypothetical protein